MSPSRPRLAPAEIERLAGVAGIGLTEQWRDDLVEGSAFVIWAKQHLRVLSRETSGETAGAREGRPA